MPAVTAIGVLALMAIVACGGGTSGGEDEATTTPTTVVCPPGQVVVVVGGSSICVDDSSGETTTTIVSSSTTVPVDTTTVTSLSIPGQQNQPEDCASPYDIQHWAPFAGISLSSYVFPDGETVDGGLFRVKQMRGNQDGYGSLAEVGEAGWIWLRESIFGRNHYRSIVVQHGERFYVVEAELYEPFLIAGNPPGVYPNPDRSPCRLLQADAHVAIWYACFFHDLGYFWVWQEGNDPPQTLQANTDCT